MDTLSHSNGNELRALLLGGHRGVSLSSGRHLLFSVDVSGDFEPANVEAQAASPDGGVILTEVRDLSAAVPQSFELAQNYPNPFNAGTTLRFRLGEATTWQLTIFNVVGQVVRRFDGNSEAGWVEISWRGDEADGGPLGSGIYFARLQAGGFSASRKMLLLK